MLPNFVIIGAQKSASTFLQQCLGDHPDVYLPYGETPFFESPDFEDSKISDLEKVFENRSERCLGIKRPNYIGKPEVPPRLTNLLPDAKLIAVLRNPIDRAISAYFHYINYGFLPPLDFEIGMRKLLLSPQYFENYRRAPEILEFGKYDKYLRMYDHYFQRDRVLIFRHEDITSDPLTRVQTAYEYLGVNPAFTPKSLSSRPQKVTYSLPRLKFLTLRNEFMLDYMHERTRVESKKRNFWQQLIAGSITGVDQLLLSRIFVSTKPKVSPELQNLLFEFYAEDIDSLEIRTGMNLDEWRPH